MIIRFSVTAGMLIVLGTGWMLTSFPALPNYEQAKTHFKASDYLLLDRDGQPLQQVRGTDHYRSLAWVTLAEVSPAVVPAILQSEDRKFYFHSGIDYSALLGSLYQRIFKGSKRGASTLSMQTVKLISPDAERWDGILGKLRQLRAVHSLEQQWSKNQILEAYLNLIPLRGELIGLPVASSALFGKMPQGLNQSEATVFAVLIRSPNAHEKWVIKRACQQDSEHCGELTELIQKSLTSRGAVKLAAESAFHLSRRLGKQEGLLKTTLNLGLQKYAFERLQAQVAMLKKDNVHDGAVFVIENETGEVWAYVGGSGALSSAPFVDGITALRQAGSTLKPFLYATAFEKKVLTPKSWIEDSALDIVFDRGVYKPQNHDRTFYGWVRAQTALASSLNVPAVKVFKLLNDEAFWQKLSDMQFHDLREPDHYGPALALGVADVSLEDLTLAYHALAAEGFYSRAKFWQGEGPPAKRFVFTPESAAQVSMILRQKEFRALGFGMDSALSAVDGASVKTGTSKDMRDNWCVGYNSRFTVGVWIGNFSGEPMWNVMGVTGAAPLWSEVMQWLNKNYPADVNTVSPLAQSEDENRSGAPMKYPHARILYPQNGMVLAMDPDIPVKNQKVPFMAEVPPGLKIEWRLNQKKIASQRNYLWAPVRGHHKLELIENGHAKQTIEILVK